MRTCASTYPSFLPFSRKDCSFPACSSRHTGLIILVFPPKGRSRCCTGLPSPKDSSPRRLETANHRLLHLLFFTSQRFNSLLAMCAQFSLAVNCINPSRHDASSRHWTSVFIEEPSPGEAPIFSAPMNASSQASVPNPTVVRAPGDYASRDRFFTAHPPAGYIVLCYAQKVLAVFSRPSFRHLGFGAFLPSAPVAAAGVFGFVSSDLFYYTLQTRGSVSSTFLQPGLRSHQHPQDGA